MRSEADTQLEEVQRQARALYGEPLPQVSGVVHVLSAVRAEPERWHVIKIDEHAPKSETDFFVLNFWRAHCDAVLTTAAVVRAEPKYSHELQGPLATGLAAYREQVLGKRNRAYCAILTRNGDLPVAHRIFDPRLATLVLTAPDRVAAVQSAFASHAAAASGARPVEIVGVDAIDIRRAIEVLRARGARTIGIEAGPSTVGPLYDAPSLVQHLMFSRCDVRVPPASVGGALPPDATLFGGSTQLSAARRDEQSGPWQFEHWGRVQDQSR